MKFPTLLLAVFSGILLWLSWPTYGFAGLLFVAFVPLLLAENRIRTSTVNRKGWKVLGLSYVTFFIWNFATTSWLYYATPFGMWFAVLVNSLLMALVILLYYLFAKKATLRASLLFLVCLWIGFEYLHLHWEFSWPWLNLGNGFSENTNWVQWYEYTGTFGGTLWVWLVNTLMYNAVLRYSKQETEKTTRALKQIRNQVVIAVFLILVPIGSSLVMKSAVKKNMHTSKRTQVVIVQPNIDPYKEKYNNANTQTIDLIERLARPVLEQQTSFLIAPETVLAEPIELATVQYNQATYDLQQLLKDYKNLHYVGGAVVLHVFRDDNMVTAQTNRTDDPHLFYDDYNSAMFLKSSGEVSLYHKSKLVVGVENFPYKSLLQPLLGDAMIDLGGTVSTKTTQKERSVFKNEHGVAIAPIICYESVYGDYVSDYVKNGAQALTIITNDAWWGNTQGHKQHLSLARLRAIENRKWIARSANTGISAIINPSGEVVRSLGYNKQGVLKDYLYPNDMKTFYTKQGDYIARIAIFMGFAVLLVGLFRNNGLTRKQSSRL